MFAGAAILAHQGGWDEMLLVAGPIVLIAGLLTLAKRRVERAAAAEAAEAEAAEQRPVQPSESEPPGTTSR